MANLLGVHSCSNCRCHLNAAPAPGIDQDSAERRHMSILSCELVGPVDWSQQLDPEDLRTILLGYHDLVKSIVKQSAGVVARF